MQVMSGSQISFVKILPNWLKAEHTRAHPPYIHTPHHITGHEALESYTCTVSNQEEIFLRALLDVGLGCSIRLLHLVHFQYIVIQYKRDMSLYHFRYHVAMVDTAFKGPLEDVQFLLASLIALCTAIVHHLIQCVIWQPALCQGHGRFQCAECQLQCACLLVLYLFNGTVPLLNMKCSDVQLLILKGYYDTNVKFW